VIRIIALTDKGLVLAEKVQKNLQEACEIWFKPTPFSEKVQQAFQQGDHLLFICATGIVIRTLAPVLANKHQDPPVIVMDEQGQFVIPLLSGHEGGANQWASELAGLIHAQLVLTTAENYLAPRHTPIYTIGMGCERHCPEQELQTLLQRCLCAAQLNIEQIHSVNSIDIKSDEVGLIQCAHNTHRPYQTFSVEQLLTVEDLLSVKSDYVFQTVGVYGVAESAALFAAQAHTGQQAELIVNKIKTAKATCAIARSYLVEAK